MAPPATRIAASVSFSCASMLLLMYVFIPKWRQRMPSAKRVFAVMTVCDLIASANYFYSGKNDGNFACEMQALIMQFFESGASWNWNTMLAIETFIVIDTFVKNIPVDRHVDFRFFIYNVLVWTFSAVSIVSVRVQNELGPSGLWCWIDNPVTALLWAYVPLWLGMLVIVWCDGWLLFYTATKTTVKVRDADISPRSVICRPGVLRFIVIPLAFICLHIPGSIRRSEAFLHHSDNKISNDLAFWQAISDPSHGTVNFFLYIAFDKLLRAECQRLVRKSCRQVWRFCTGHQDDNVEEERSTVSRPTTSLAESDMERDAHSRRHSSRRTHRASSEGGGMTDTYDEFGDSDREECRAARPSRNGYHAASGQYEDDDDDPPLVCGQGAAAGTDLSVDGSGYGANSSVQQSSDFSRSIYSAAMRSTGSQSKTGSSISLTSLSNGGQSNGGNNATKQHVPCREERFTEQSFFDEETGAPMDFGDDYYEGDEVGLGAVSRPSESNQVWQDIRDTFSRPSVRDSTLSFAGGGADRGTNQFVVSQNPISNA